MLIETFINRIIITWIFFIGSMLGIIMAYQTNSLFVFGPNPNLYILGVCIDTTEKYVIVASFCFINSGVRTANHNMIQSWIINILQDQKIVTHADPCLSYEFTLTSTLYIWFDFFMYMNIIMSQIDMFLIEVISDMITTCIVTTYYLRVKQKDQNLEDRNLEDRRTLTVV